MNKTHFFIKQVLIALCIFGVISCENTEPDAQIVEIIDQEGFMSTTGNSNTFIKEDQSEAVKPIFHMSFGAEIGKEEAIAKFEEAIAEHKQKINNQKIGPGIFTGPITKLGYTVIVKTGDVNNAGTNGDVRIGLDFRTDKGNFQRQNIYLDKKNDKKRNLTDFYYLSINLPNPVNLEWIELRSGFIELKGTNGWYLEDWKVGIGNPGNSTKLSGEEEGFWLDSSCNQCWDRNSSNDGSGRYYFD